MTVEVVYALPDVQRAVVVTLEPGATVATAIRESGLLDVFPDIDLEVNKVGVYGELRTLDSPVRDGDRVEIYRPLRADPKAARRARARRR